MNITTYSPALALLYVFFLLCILMDVDAKSLGRVQRWLVLSVIVVLCFANHVLREVVGVAAYGKLMILCMHLPTFFLFLYIKKQSVIKTAFMILTALVFTAPTVLIGNWVRHALFVGSPQALLLSNLLSYVLMLLLAQFLFRKGFNYLLSYGSDHFFLLLSLIPFVYYIYVIAIANFDTSSFTTFAGYAVRFVPTVHVFLLYLLLPFIYRFFRENMKMEAAQTALEQKLTSAANQIAMLNETNTQMAIFRHDIRHQFIELHGLLSSGNYEQAQEFVKNVMGELEAITPKRFCENETVNLMCSYYEGVAKRLGIKFIINAHLPQNLSVSDTDLCSVVSNGLENAMSAASHPNLVDKWVGFYCEMKGNKLLIQIQNSYSGEVVMENGLPVSTQEGHGYGCRSIQDIAQRNKGLCSFEAEGGIITLRVLLHL